MEDYKNLKPTVYGVGKNDLKHLNVSKDKEYRVWRDVLKRCYDKGYLAKYPTYKGTIVCDDWLIYSKFAKDLREIKNFEMLGDGWVLDKDICSNKRIYSKETCCIVPEQVNIFFSTFSTEHNPAFDPRWGVYYCYCNNDGKKYYLGRFKTTLESKVTYLCFKIGVIKSMILKYKNIVDDRVIESLDKCMEDLYESMLLL